MKKYLISALIMAVLGVYADALIQQHLNSGDIKPATVTADTVTADNFIGTFTGTAAVANALAANGANCPAGEGAGGTSAAGVAEDCTDYIDAAGDTMTGQLTIAGSTLTITGDAFSVGGTTFVVQFGRIGIGTGTPSQKLDLQSELGAAVQITAFVGFPALFLRGSGGTQAAPTATTNNNTLAFIGAFGHDGTDFGTGSKALLRMRAAESWTLTANGTDITMETTENLTTSRKVRMSWTDDGRIGIGSGNPDPVSLLDVQIKPVEGGISTGVNINLDGSAGAHTVGNFSGIFVTPKGNAGDTAGGFYESFQANDVIANGGAATYRAFRIGTGYAEAITIQSGNIGMSGGGSFNLSGGGDISVAGGNFVGDSSVTASGFFGDGSGLVGVTDTGAVQKTGDTMTGQLTLFGSTLTVTGDAFSVGSSTFVVTGGNVGIGTTNPLAPLEVFRTGAGEIERIVVSGNNLGTIGYYKGGGAVQVGKITIDGQGDLSFDIFALNGGSPLLFGTQNVERMRITGAGNVGIGTPSPATLLDINGDAQFGSGATKSTFTTAGNLQTVSGFTVSGGTVSFQDRVSIGDGTPTTDTAINLHISNGDVLMDNDKAIKWIANDSTIHKALTVESTDDLTIGSSSFDDVVIKVGMLGEAVRIKQITGNMGIGTASPTRRLHVSSTSNGQVMLSGATAIFDGTDTSIQDSGALLFHSALVNAVGHRTDIVATGADAGNFNSAMAFWTRPSGGDPTERMRITGAGNVGIGTVTPDRALEISGTSNDTASARISSFGSGFSSRLEIQRANGTEASPTVVFAGNQLGQIAYRGYDGTNFADTALIHAVANENWAVGSHGSRLEFQTTPDGSTTFANRMIIHDDGVVEFLGNIGIGTADSTISVGIGDTDTGINKVADGAIQFMSQNNEVFRLDDDVAGQQFQFNVTNALASNPCDAGNDVLETTADGTLRCGIEDSDERLKNVIGREILYGLEEVISTELIQFTWNELSGHSMEEGIEAYQGFSAQNLLNTAPQLVFTGHEGYYGMDQNGLIATSWNAIRELHSVLLKAMQEQQKQIQEQQKQIEALKRAINEDRNP